MRPLPVRGVLKLGGGSDTWFKAALSAVVASAIPNLTLLAFGRLDLALYTSAGSLVALYAHGRPYAARARTLARLALLMLASLAIALTTAALTEDVAIRVAVAALLAAGHKLVSDASRIGPPGNVIFTFVASSCAFVPQRLADVPLHVGLGLAGAVISWLVCMAPALVRPDGPERLAVARALEATARLRRATPPAADAADADSAGTDSAAARARHDAATAINAAWHTLFLLPAGAAERRVPLERLVVRAESVLGGASAPQGRLLAWAAALRSGRPVPVPAGTDAAETGELAGIADERRARAASRPQGTRAVLAALRRGSPLLPVATRVGVSAAAAGWLTMLLGVGRPYWAVVTAAAIFQANLVLTWRRALQRVLGNLLGLALFTALLPVIGIGPFALVLVALAAQFGAEAGMSRNYWLGSVFVTPMALSMVEFAGYQPARELVGDRWLDTCVGAAVGLLGCVLITNRRASGRIDGALARLSAAVAETHAVTRAAPGTVAALRDRVTAALVDLRDAVDVAEGEWWQRALPAERVERAERDGHRALATLTAAAPADREAA
ncbi:FUSC family protein [Spirillospora sp. NPDC052269]